jgi:spore coat protein U-like protein
MIERLTPAAALLALCCIATPAQADVTGTVDATITLTAGCIINAQNVDNGAGTVDFGTIDFGSHNTLFTTADSEVVGSASGIAVQCSPGITPSLVLGAGEHDGLGTGSGNRAMMHASASGQYVRYALYSDSGRNTPLTIGQSLALASNGSAQTIHIYGRAFGTAGLVTGTYSDTVLVTLQL